MHIHDHNHMNIHVVSFRFRDSRPDSSRFTQYQYVCWRSTWVRPRQHDSRYILNHTFVQLTVNHHRVVSAAGTDEERGIKEWRQMIGDADSQIEQLKVYNLPFCSERINSWRCSKYMPLCPAFDPTCGRKKSVDEDIVVVKTDLNDNMYLKTKEFDNSRL